MLISFVHQAGKHVPGRFAQLAAASRLKIQPVPHAAPDIYAIYGYFATVESFGTTPYVRVHRVYNESMTRTSSEKKKNTTIHTLAIHMLVLFSPYLLRVVTYYYFPRMC